MNLGNHMVLEMRGRRPDAPHPMAGEVRRGPALDHVKGRPDARAYVAWWDRMSEKTVEVADSLVRIAQPRLTIGPRRRHT